MTEDARLGADAPASPPPRVADASLSPSVDRGDGVDEATAYELKFLVTEDVARSVRTFADSHLRPDPHADADGGYGTTTLYLDTADWAILRRAEGVRGRKHRVRRYGDERFLHLERKTRRGDRVRKLRVCVPDADVARLERPATDDAWPGAWFAREVEARKLSPVCRLSYRRTAFFAAGPAGPMRLTLDRRIVGAREDAWRITPVKDGPDILDGRVVCELKFRDSLPDLFKRLVAECALTPSGVSKYRRFMEAAGVRFGGGEGDA